MRPADDGCFCPFRRVEAECPAFQAKVTALQSRAGKRLVLTNAGRLLVDEAMTVWEFAHVLLAEPPGE